MLLLSTARYCYESILFQAAHFFTSKTELRCSPSLRSRRYCQGMGKWRQARAFLNCWFVRSSTIEFCYVSKISRTKIASWTAPSWIHVTSLACFLRFTCFHGEIFLYSPCSYSLMGATKVLLLDRTQSTEVTSQADLIVQNFEHNTNLYYCKNVSVFLWLVLHFVRVAKVELVSLLRHICIIVIKPKGNMLMVGTSFM